MKDSLIVQSGGGGRGSLGGVREVVCRPDGRKKAEENRENEGKGRRSREKGEDGILGELNSAMCILYHTVARSWQDFSASLLFYWLNFIFS